MSKPTNLFAHIKLNILLGKSSKCIGCLYEIESKQTYPCKACHIIRGYGVNCYYDKYEVTHE